MKKISLNAVYEPLVFEINGEEVRVKVDTTPKNLKPLSELCHKNGTEMKPIEKARNKAIAEGDVREAERTSSALADKIMPILNAALVGNGTEELITALGGGVPVNPSDCIEQLVMVMDAIIHTIRDHFGLSAAQMTAGAADALQATNNN